MDNFESLLVLSDLTDVQQLLDILDNWPIEMRESPRGHEIRETTLRKLAILTGERMMPEPSVN